jgi:hypothetical protein
MTISLVAPSHDCNTAQTQQETQPILHSFLRRDLRGTRWCCKSGNEYTSGGQQGIGRDGQIYEEIAKIAGTAKIAEIEIARCGVDVSSAKLAASYTQELIVNG